MECGGLAAAFPVPDERRTARNGCATETEGGGRDRLSGALGAREKNVMQRLMASVGTMLLGLSMLAAAQVARGDERLKGPEEDGTKPALTKIAGEGMMNSHAFEFLTELSDDVGSRVTGSPEAQKAVDWGIAKMRGMGLENVHAEKWQLWRGWKRGSAEAELLAPIRRELHVDAMGWTGSTPAGGAEGEVVAMNMFDMDEEMKDLSRMKGKVVLVVSKGSPKKDFDRIFAEFGNFLNAARKAGALVVIGGQGGSNASGLNLTHTGILGFNADFEIPVVSVTAEDQGQLERYVNAGAHPRVRFNIQNTFTNGPVESANVVGEIRGREHPEQILVVGGHLDSWDLSQGTTDNGSGTATTLGAADSIMRSGAKPRRTIRFVLFTGEEQGLDGSIAYIKQHHSELANHLGDLILDAGQGEVKGFQLGGRSDLMDTFQPFADSLAAMGPMSVDDKIEDGTDTLTFTIAGL